MGGITDSAIDNRAIDDILEYWFGKSESSRNDLWFARNQDIDDDIRARFGALMEPAGRGELDAWAETPRGRLALILVLDQFSRNLHRDSALAYANDAKAQALCLEGIERAHDRALPLIQRWFFYMPLEHAEDAALQDKSVRCFETVLGEAPADKRQIYQGALDYAHSHRDVIARFGRFPHRNELLGRVSTAEEKAHLATGRWF